MKQFLKIYGVGLLPIIIILQPFAIAKLIRLNTQCDGCMSSAYFITIIAEMLFIGMLALPYIIGRNIMKNYKKMNKLLIVSLLLTGCLASTSEKPEHHFYHQPKYVRSIASNTSVDKENLCKGLSMFYYLGCSDAISEFVIKKLLSENQIKEELNKCSQASLKKYEYCKSKFGE